MSVQGRTTGGGNPAPILAPQGEGQRPHSRGWESSRQGQSKLKTLHLGSPGPVAQETSHQAPIRALGAIRVLSFSVLPQLS